MCTDFLIGATDGTIVNGRSMEFGIDLKGALIVRAPGKSAGLVGWLEDKLHLVPKYGYVGVTSFGLPVCSDGVNSQGLSTGALWLPGSEYQAPDAKATNVFCGFFVDWLLGNCATVAEVRQALESGAVRVVGDRWVAKAGPLHFPVHDAAGNSIVIEFLGGQPVISDNPVKVLTNLPTFPWHLTNLQNYVSLTPWDADPMTVGDLTVSRPGHGTGLAGLPGNATPPARFIRTALLKQFADQPTTAAEAQSLAFHLLNAVDIPKGTVRARKSDGEVECDYTQWVVVKDLTNRVITIRMAASPMPWSLDLKTVDFESMNGRQIAIPAAMSNPLPV